MGTPEEEVIQGFERSAGMYGLSPSYGRIYGVLYFSDNKLTLDELSDKSDFAKSTVSDAINDLENLHFVERIPSDDPTRKVYFKAREDFEEILQELIDEKFQKEADLMLDAIKSSKNKVDAKNNPEKYRKLEKLEKTYSKGQKYMNLFTKLNPHHLIDVAEKFLGLTGRDS